MTPRNEALEVFPYTSAQAFGAAITSRLKGLAGVSGYSASQLRRQFAYDRLLARLFIGNSQEWILKGGVSMIARLGVARHTADVDLVAKADSADAALIALRHAAAQDLGDFFAFRFEPPRSLVQGAEGLRIPTEAWLGPRIFERFGVDLVTPSERHRRNLSTVDELVIPAERLWRTGYLTAGSDVPGLAEKTLAEALPLAKSFVDPVLAGRNGGATWNPTVLAWQ